MHHTQAPPPSLCCYNHPPTLLLQVVSSPRVVAVAYHCYGSLVPGKPLLDESQRDYMEAPRRPPRKGKVPGRADEHSGAPGFCAHLVLRGYLMSNMVEAAPRSSSLLLLVCITDCTWPVSRDLPGLLGECLTSHRVRNRHGGNNHNRTADHVSSVGQALWLLRAGLSQRAHLSHLVS